MANFYAMSKLRLTKNKIWEKYKQIKIFFKLLYKGNAMAPIINHGNANVFPSYYQIKPRHLCSK